VVKAEGFVIIPAAWIEMEINKLVGQHPWNQRPERRSYTNLAERYPSRQGKKKNEAREGYSRKLHSDM
jgi:hypothetical protein